ncbi:MULTISPECIES: hypothetical protein [Dehalobacter]|jgi:hypothetical protein|uniref:Uncharacterized protein n=1 Tax=Dehalobacter restrictus TaxID=55583 RepID=A0A857DEN3_9FIRM|nr:MULTISPECIES: hypothetical protein [Dehalobacter]MCG1025804.1 hypothetical protein [Dehalobacter sp.]MDJ0306466.1 hypothetical protein [Dehalobacter sp.]QGZ99729.1 hypothetical protein GQ588_03210 [Dehalobacter restrictus]
MIAEKLDLKFFTGLLNGRDINGMVLSAPSGAGCGTRLFVPWMAQQLKSGWHHAVSLSLKK